MAKRSKLSKKLRDFLEEFPPLICRIENGRIVPTNQHDWERLMSWKGGSTVQIWIGQDGSRPLVRAWWGTINWYLKNTELPWSDANSAHVALKNVLNMVRTKRKPDGSLDTSEPMSLSDIEDADLERCLTKMQDLLQMMTGVDRETMRREGGDFDAPPEDTGFNPPAPPVDESPDEMPAPSPSSGDAVGAAEAPPSQGGADAPQDPDDAKFNQAWLRQATVEMWTSTDVGEQRLLIDVANALKKDTPARVTRETRDIATKVREVCWKVCTMELKRQDALKMLTTITGMKAAEIDRMNGGFFG